MVVPRFGGEQMCLPTDAENDGGDKEDARMAQFILLRCLGNLFCGR
jgi:hypothetical protein